MSMIVLITAGKGFALLSALNPKPSASRHHPFRPIGSRYLCPCCARRYLLAPISSNFFLVKISADCIITTLANSTYAKFSQSECFVCTRFNFYV